MTLLGSKSAGPHPLLHQVMPDRAASAQPQPPEHFSVIGNRRGNDAARKIKPKQIWEDEKDQNTSKCGLSACTARK